MESGALTQQQRAAVETEHANVLVTAPAGSGKTKVIAERANYLVTSRLVHPKDIAIVTYTNEAARVIAERIGGPLGFTGTLHAFCMQAIRAGMEGGEDYRVIDDQELKERLMSAAEDIEHRKASPTRLALVNAEWRGGEMDTHDKIAVARYRQRALRDGVLDYDSILAIADALMKDERTGRAWEHLIVDEWQDAAAMDWQIYSHAQAANRFFVGDPNQAIFGFRGGRSDGPPAGGWLVLELNDNFRSTPEICAAASRLAAGLELRPARAENFAGSSPGIHARRFDNEAAEAVAIAASLTDPAEAARTAILARTNAIADYIREILDQHGITTRHMADVERPPDWRLAMAALGFLARPKSTRALRRYMSARFPGQDIDAIATTAPITGDADKLDLELLVLGAGDDSIEQIETRLGELPDTASLLDLESSLTLDRQRAEKGSSEGAFVGTIHSAKGREFYRVILAGFEDEIIPGHAKRTDHGEERRVAYVGVTRARDQLIFTWAATRRTNYGLRHPEPRTASRFLKDTLP